ncbi:Oidioi.mRNA.OKI2018_I69.chr1.g3861.t1.cds [Oikopleura dioica]|uniref:ribonuclease H n=1 Tax=Oikopleura dioica TaxID=34765 RepID=A0ABN7SVD1_OIKDI|nr:Oidioi.mRNA.OKI2018_I69.chr1.g3861.t1.cds [Oikopleura dioica]
MKAILQEAEHEGLQGIQLIDAFQTIATIAHSPSIGINRRLASTNKVELEMIQGKLEHSVRPVVERLMKQVHESNVYNSAEIVFWAKMMEPLERDSVSKADLLKLEEAVSWILGRLWNDSAEAIFRMILARCKPPENLNSRASPRMTLIAHIWNISMTLREFLTNIDANQDFTAWDAIRTLRAIWPPRDRIAAAEYRVLNLNDIDNRLERGLEDPSSLLGTTYEKLFWKIPIPRSYESARAAAGFKRKRTSQEAEELEVHRGPKSLPEWKIYETDLLHRVIRVLNNEAKPDWETLALRKESDFIAGQWTHNKDNWRVLIHQMPEKVKPLIYHFVHGGADLFLNLKRIPPQETCRIQAEGVSDNMEAKFGQLRHFEKTRRKFQNLIGKRYKSLTIPSQEAVRERSDEIVQQITDWCEMGSVTRVTDSKGCWIRAGFVLVDKPGRETRVCWNGGVLKPLQLYTFPCKLESVGAAIQMLKKGDLLYKFDDKKGFHQLPLSEESKKLACFDWGGQYFRNNILAFGIPAAPGIYQLMNLCGVNFLRKNGIKITLYLDDRLLAVTPESEEDRRQLLAGEKVGKEVWATVATLVALGGYVNITKSTFKPTQRIEFLGFILDTESETVEIPMQRWAALKNLMKEAEAKTEVPSQMLERIRGTMASMAEVLPNMRMLIRQTTILISQALREEKESCLLTKEVREEWRLWTLLEEKGLKRHWTKLNRQETGLIIFTDASSHAGAIVIEQWKLEERFAWEAEMADKHIGIKEALAIQFTLEWYGQKLKNQRALFLCDNDSVVQGAIAGSKDPEMNTILVRIWTLAQRFNIDMKVDWVSTKKQLADAPSRDLDSREQKLTANGFAYLQSHLSDPLDIDVAATPLNNKCRDFIARRETKGAFGRDFLSFPIHELIGRKLYAFPPPKIAHKYYNRLTEIATPWALVVPCFEAEPLVVTQAKLKGYRVFDIPADSILTPAKVKTIEGYWKVATNVSTIKIIANRL